MVQIFFQNLHEVVMCKILKTNVKFDFREEFVYSDGGTIHLDWKWAEAPDHSEEAVDYARAKRDTRPIVFLIPGSGNDSDEIYMQNQVKLLIAKGFHTVCIGPRGQQGINKFTSYQIRCPGRDSDIREVVDYVDIHLGKV